MADRKAPHSLKEQSADQIRNEQRGGAGSPIDPNRDGGPEANATMRRVWDEPGGEAYNFRNATVEGGGGWSVPTPSGPGGHGDLTAAETPETTRHLSDASLGPDDRDATGEAIARAAAAGDRQGDATAGQDEAERRTPTTHSPGNPAPTGSVKRSGT